MWERILHCEQTAIKIILYSHIWKQLLLEEDLIPALILS